MRIVNPLLYFPLQLEEAVFVRTFKPNSVPNYNGATILFNIMIKADVPVPLTPPKKNPDKETIK